ncbi:hypothetical protein JOF56_009783 [Kibdelosporangium banguiense]|uniref:Peptidase M28 domain-containing protein n=1 Tax=Kibdelosporangium banguiense TaxID=1365924 RepID=A0ABS4TYC7_9PSEU|nr:M28 family peptidase [Kibdelosporangium banguiense]MBP2329398.1 hypothetical protein [Kibdelosporangium banguiense]
MSAAVHGTFALRPPRAAGWDTPSTRFSSARACRHLPAIASSPHPTGSPENDRVREYVLRELKELGFDVEIQDAFATNDLGPTPYGPRYLTAGRVRNIIARRPGASEGRAVLLMTHYDSVAQGSGASDPGAPLAAMLEALRVLAADKQPRNDLVVVVSDGEEAGLLGAKAFFDEHPLARDVVVACNFDARGTSGPVLMFEAGPSNSTVIRELARSGAPVFASSLFDEIYRRMDNATDFTIAKQRGTAGLNFAHINGFVHYHGPHDDIEHVDLGSVQHHGELMLSVARRLLALDTAQASSSSDDVFFTLGAGRLVRYRTALALPLAVGATAAWAAAAAVVWRRNRFTAKQLGTAAAKIAGKLALSAASTTMVMQTIGNRNPEFRRHGDVKDSHDIYLAITASAVGAVGALPTKDAARIVVATAPLAVASVASALRMPGATYLSTWPLLGGVAALAACAMKQRGLGYAVVRSAAALPAAMILVPLSRLMFHGLTPRLSGAAAVVLHLSGELAAVAMPHRIRSAVRLAAFGLSTMAVVRRLTGKAPQGPRPENLSYLLDADQATARWISSDDQPTLAIRTHLGTSPDRVSLERYFPGWRREFLSAPAIAHDIPEPTVQVVRSERVTGGRRVELVVGSRRSARQISIAIREGMVRGWRVEGRPGPASDAGHGPWELWLHAMPDREVHIELDLPESPVDIRVLDRTDGLPDGGPEIPHPAAALDVETWGNATIVSRVARI